MTIEGRVRVNADKIFGEKMTVDDEILCDNRALTDAIADWIENKYEGRLCTTGYYDPVEDAKHGNVDERTGWWYVRCD